MKKVVLLSAVALLGAFLLASVVLAAGTLPGQNGPDDTKAIVESGKVKIMFTPETANGPVTYTVYRHDRNDGRHFEQSGNPCAVDTSGNPSGCDSSWGKDPYYGYITYTDNNIVDYEEYYYYVQGDNDAYPTDLNAYVVTAAFPPTQTRHGNYSEYTNACTACHGLHSSKFSKLLKGPSVTDLCGTCHDGTGSKYDEVGGLVRKGPSWSNAAFAAAGPFGDRLKANSGVTVTSVHNVMRADDPSYEPNGNINTLADSARVWQAPGSGWLNSAPNTSKDLIYKFVSNAWSSYLVCSSCHEPHNRSKNYRILRAVINDRTNILVRGVSEVDPNASDGSSDRGNWEQRAMYTKFLSGGNSVMTWYDNKYEDPGKYSNPQAKCGSNGGTWISDSTSPTGGRCQFQTELGGVTTFCSACHRAFFVTEGRMRKTSFTYPYGSGTMSGMENSTVTNGGPGPQGMANGASLNNTYGEHRHPIALGGMHAWEEGKIIDGPIAPNGEVCHGENGVAMPGVGQGPCAYAGQHRVKDPIVPLEGLNEKSFLQELIDNAGYDNNGIPQTPSNVDLEATYQDNKVVCLTCHVAHGSGSEKIEVAYDNGGLNGTTGFNRDSITGYFWTRTSVDNYTQLGNSSVLARFNPMASACYRCHSATK